MIDNDNGSHMRPMPGMVIAAAVTVSMGMATSFVYRFLKCHFVFACLQGTYLILPLYVDVGTWNIFLTI